MSTDDVLVVGILFVLGDVCVLHIHVSHQSFTIVICYIVEAVVNNKLQSEVAVTSNSSTEVSHD